MSQPAEINRDQLDWHYGPTDVHPDPGLMWHDVCHGEVLALEEGYICQRCNQQEGTSPEYESMQVLRLFARIDAQRRRTDAERGAGD